MSRRRTSHDPLFDEPESKPWGKYALIAAIVGVGGFILYAAFAGGNAPQGPVPVIRADETPWTRAPSEAGGMDIPNQDSMVYELMEKQEGDASADATPETAAEEKAEEKAEGTQAEESEIVTEIADTEKEVLKDEGSETKTMDQVMQEATGDKSGDGIVDKPADKAVDVIGGAPTTPAVDKTVGETAAKTVEKPVDNTVTASEDETADKPVEKTADKSVDKTEDKPVEKAARDPDLDAPYDPKKAASPTTAAKSASSASSSSGGGTVQVRLGSVPGTDMGKANAEFSRLKSLSGGKLTGSAMMEPVTLDKGSFIRINATMSEGQARSLCDTLSSKGAPCVVLGR